MKEIYEAPQIFMCSITARNFETNILPLDKNLRIYRGASKNASFLFLGRYHIANSQNILFGLNTNM